MTEYRDSRRRSRSRDRPPTSSKQDDRPKRRKRRVGWNDPTDRVTPDSAAVSFEQQQMQLLALQQQMGNKKARELYVGNLASGQVSSYVLKDHFNSMFYQLPEFNAKYEFLRSTGAGSIQDVKMSTCGTYAFVQFYTEEIAVTALEFDKHEFLGRQMRIGRPTGVVLTTPPPPPMDVMPLRNSGYLPLRSGVVTVLGAADKKQREIYVGNLHPSVLTSELIRELFEPAMRLIPDYAKLDHEKVPSPILAVDFGGDGKFAFVEFVTESLATAGLVIFNQVELLGRKMTVMRPQGYVAPK
jgi:RNA recognition motif-containing protein